MPTSAYTIGVSQCHPNGTRDVTLKHHGKACFTATHRDVLWAFLTSFVPPGGCPGRTAPPSSYSAETPAATPSPGNFTSVLNALSEHEPDGEGANGGVESALKPHQQQCHRSGDAPMRCFSEYLCIFHREELKDRFGRYTVSQPSTLCTAYSVKDAAFSQFVLHNVSPTTITAGTSGVFVHGRRQTSRWGHAPPLVFDGETYYPAADTWWMASPLVIKPVYVLVGSPVSPASTAVSSPRDPCVGARHMWASREGDGAHSRCGTPSPGTHHVSTHNALLDAVVLGQFRVRGSQDVVLARTGERELGLALTEPKYHVDVLAWRWLPHRVSLPRLSSSNSALSLTVSEHHLLSAQVLFLSDSQNMNIYLLRTPNLPSGEGAMEVLAVLPNAAHPLVLPCVRPSIPQPILVCNYPHNSEVTLYEPVRLLSVRAGSPSASERYVARASLAGSDGTLTPRRSTSGSLPQITAEPRSAFLDCSDDGGMRGDIGTSSGHHYTPLGAHTTEDASSCQTTDGRIDAVTYQDGVSVVFGRSCSTSLPPNTSGAGLPRRRCERKMEFPVEFPSLCSDLDPFVSMVLETLEAAIGHERVGALEYALLQRAWASAREGGSWGCRARCQALIVGTVQASLAAASGAGERSAVPARGTIASTSRDKNSSDWCHTLGIHTRHRQCALLSDPSILSATSIEALCDSGGAAGSGSGDDTGATGDARLDTIIWPVDVCAMCLVSLHILCESCKLQERLWPLLEPLTLVNTQLSALLGLPRYTSVYALTATPACNTPEKTSSAVGSIDADTMTHNFSRSGVEEVLSLFDFTPPARRDEERCSVIFLDDGRCGTVQSTRTLASGLLSGAPPLVHNCLRAVLQGGDYTAMGSNGSGSGGGLLPSAAVQVDSASSGGSHCRGNGARWPMLRGLPAHHPITMANRVYCLYSECLSTTGRSRRRITAARWLSGEAPQKPWWEAVCWGLLQYGITPEFVHRELCVGVAYPIITALSNGRDHPQPGWPEELYAVVGRLDHIQSPSLLSRLGNPGSDVLRSAEARAVERRCRATLTDDDGVNMRPDFRKTWTDSRLDVVQALLNTASPIYIPASQNDSPDILLRALSRRACAMPIGRGLFTMCTQNVKIRDSIPLPPLNLHGRTAEGLSITNSDESMTTSKLVWPTFHNGCAAGLRFLTLGNTSPAAVTSGAGDSETVGEGEMEATEGGVGADASRREQAHSTGGTAITRHWVVYQTRNVPCPASRAGLLLAAGILGHLRVLQLTDIYSLLVSQQPQYVWREATTIAVMLGLSCSFRGTNNDLVFRCLSMHVQSLTPSAEEIEVSMDMQTSALVSIGLLCQQMPTNMFLVEMLLVEMSRAPSDEHCLHREGYALGAGIGLGLLLLGLGSTHRIPNVERRLFSYLSGGRREPVPSAREGLDNFIELGTDDGHFLTRALLTQGVRESHKGSCVLVCEGDHYNTTVSGPAAVMALGMIYIKTNHREIAQKLSPPNQNVALQGVPPQLCLLRCALASLVCWDDVAPTREWVFRSVPSSLVHLSRTAPCMLGLSQQQVQYLMMNYGHCIAGATLALGLRYAGSMDADARTVIIAELRGFIKGQIGSTGIAMSTLQRSTGAYETCLCACVSAISLVMAGTGDLKVFALLQKLHKRPTITSYGVHMAVSMAIGMLFLGGGRLTLSNSTPSIAALLISHYPVWPRSTEDNVHHLQALRHLYALAVVPRVIETIDAVGNQPVSVPVRVIVRKGRVRLHDGDDYDGSTGFHGRPGSGQPSWTPVPRGQEEREVRLHTPCLYPPADTIERIEVRGTAYYPIVIHNNGGGREITENGLTIRVLRNREAEEAHTRLLSSTRTGTLPHSTSEQRVMDWLRRLFSHPGTSVMEALAILDNIKLLQVSQKALLSSATEMDNLLSVDFGQSVAQTLERRYEYIFLHARHNRSDTDAGATSVDRHPLYSLIMRQRPFSEVLSDIAEHPTGSPSFPCDFTALVEAAAQPPPLSFNGAQQHQQPEEADSHTVRSVTLDLRGLSRWIAEAVHYYDIGGDTRELQAALTAQAGQLRGAPAHTRVAALLRLHLQFRMPLSTLEKLVDCCLAL